MRVVVAPDSFGGTLSARAAAEAIARGWAQARPGDELRLVPLADGGEGTLDVLAGALNGGEVVTVEVADPRGRPRDARLLLTADGLAVVESAEACGLSLLARDERDPLRTTTYGVGQLLEAARGTGARRVAVGLGGSATVDGGAGALVALGMRVRRADGGGVKIGGGELVHVAAVEPRWVDPVWEETDVQLWTDVRTVLDDAAATYGPQKGATPEAVEQLAAGLRRWADVVERDLDGQWRDLPGSGAAGGLGFGLAAVLDAPLVSGAAAVAARVGLPAALERADLVVAGEGTLDATSGQGKAVGHVLDLAADLGVPAVAVVGRRDGAVERLDDVEESSRAGPGERPADDVAAAAARLAARL